VNLWYMADDGTLQELAVVTKVLGVVVVVSPRNGAHVGIRREQLRARSFRCHALGTTVYTKRGRDAYLAGPGVIVEFARLWTAHQRAQGNTGGEK